MEKLSIPRHIAIIMDGNGRWAKKRGLPRMFGHRAGTNATRRIVRACGELGVEVLTIYVFSSENWKRPLTEVSALMKLLIEMVRKEVSELNKNNVRLLASGDIAQLPGATRAVLLKGISDTANNTGLKLNLAVSYGGRQEILRAVKNLCREALQGKVQAEDIDERLFSQYLYTRDFPDPELLIRTGGEMRVSNFLLWQIAYTELYVTEVLWPDFKREHLLAAIHAFQQRDRRFGRVDE